MTTYAGKSILECSSCSGHISHSLLASGNTFGARYWTDGWRDAPMLPEELELVRCPHCGAMVWMSDLEELAEVSPFDEVDADFPAATDYEEPRARDLLQYAGLNPDLDEYRQRYVRMHAWWRGNDSRRDAEQPAPLSPEERDNLIKLIALLDQDDENDRLMSAEAMRQLGDFSAAKELLSGSFSEGMQRAVDIIANLTQKQVSPVVEMEF